MCSMCVSVLKDNDNRENKKKACTNAIESASSYHCITNMNLNMDFLPLSLPHFIYISFPSYSLFPFISVPSLSFSLLSSPFFLSFLLFALYAVSFLSFPPLCSFSFISTPPIFLSSPLFSFPSPVFFSHSLFYYPIFPFLSISFTLLF